MVAAKSVMIDHAVIFARLRKKFENLGRHNSSCAATSRQSPLRRITI
jgi:hypothetical protein